MAHNRTNIDTVVHVEDKEWLPISAQVTRLTNDWARRNDLVAYVGKHSAIRHGKLVAPAFFNPKTAEIEVNSPEVFGATAAKHIDLSKRSGLFEHPAGVGVVYHEAMHAAFSTQRCIERQVELEKATERQVYMMLEESRIEKWGVRRHPENRVFLRASALELCLQDTDESIKEMSAARQAAHLAGLSLARVDARVLDKSDVKEIRKAVEKILTRPTVRKLRDIWQEFQDIEDADDAGNTDRMLELAREFDQIVQEQAEENGEDTSGDEAAAGGQEGEGEEGEGGGSPMSEAMAEAMKELMDALGKEAKKVSVAARSQANEQDVQEKNAEKQKVEAAKRNEKESNEKQASKVFSNASGPLEGKTNSRLVESRTPTGQERIAAVTLGRELDKAKYVDSVRVESASAIPPGRLRTRAVVQGAALRARGVRGVQVEPFERVQRKRVEDPNLTVGMMVDISGSMSGAMNPMASTAWIMSEAVKRIQGKAAMVYYGQSVFPTLKPGEHLDAVKVYSARDGSEDFKGGFAALDGALNLLYGTGARLLVVVSDGSYGGQGQAEAAAHAMRRCQEAGVAVLWIGHGGPSYYGDGNKFDAETYTDPTDAVFIRGSEDVTGDALAIGRAAAAALTAAGKRRQHGG